MKKGKTDKARKALERTYGTGDQSFIDIELKRITENVRFSEEVHREAAVKGPLLYQCFRGTNLVFMLIIVLISETDVNCNFTGYRATGYWSILLRWM